MRFISFFTKKRYEGGFTLVELLVTISIFAVVTGIVLINQARFNSTILLSDLAYDVALDIRLAQNYGVNVRQYENGTTKNFTTGYGVFFNQNYPKNLVLFADANTDNTFTADSSAGDMNSQGFCDASPSECLDRYTIKQGNSIEKFCVYETGVAQPVCSDMVDNAKLDIVFRRPQPDAIFNFTYKTSSVLSSTITKAVITLVSADGSGRRTIEVNTTGQIAVGR